MIMVGTIRPDEFNKVFHYTPIRINEFPPDALPEKKE
jgi:hypothetical protein